MINLADNAMSTKRYHRKVYPGKNLKRRLKFNIWIAKFQMLAKTLAINSFDLDVRVKKF